MVEINDPNQFVAALGVVVLSLAAFWRLILWVRAAKPAPDPWSAEIEASLQAEDATPICHRCLTPHSNVAWFCDHCGSAVGAYNNLMPFVCAFSEGEVFRNGVTDKMRASPFLIGGYLLCSLSCYVVFAPIYWFFFFRNLKRLKVESLHDSPEAVE